MSHSYPYRRPPPPADESQPNLGTYSSSDHNHASGGYNFYRQAPEASSKPSSSSPSSSSYPLSSSSRASAEPLYSGPRLDSTVSSILSSCGLEPKDLALLAELPEDVLTLESLPHLLNEIKGKRETPAPYPSIPSSSSSSLSSSRPPDSSLLPVASPPNSGEWDRLRSQPVQYPLNHAFMTSKPLPPEQVQGWQDRWGNPRKNSTIAYKPSSSSDPPPPSSSSSSSSYIVDYAHTGKPTDNGKKWRDGGPVSRYDHPSYSSAAGGDVNRKAPPRIISQPRSADYRCVPPPPEEQRPKGRAERRESGASYNNNNNNSSGNGRLSTALAMPSRKSALDFHGTLPTAYPYSCSLCDITVLSEKFWVQHINAPQHADGQLTLLQLFPDWDCRLETISRTDDQPKKPKEEGRPAQQPRTTSQSSYPRPNKNAQKKHSGNGKVVSVKFPAQSVDEKYLRTLMEPFGKIVKVITFPSLAFVELGSSDQAKDLVKYYSSNPASVDGEELSFYISSTFNFLQSSQVLSFTPAPDGEDGPSDLITIIKRFGSPLYTLFLPSMAFIQMKNAADAQKVVEYYSSNTLRINGEIIKVSFSGEYNTLMRVSSAKKYEEESPSAKRSRTPSPRRRAEPNPSKRIRSSRERRKKEWERRTRSRTRSRSSDRSSRDGRSRERAAVPDKTQQTETQSKADRPASPKPEATQNAPTKEETPPSSEEEEEVESDIEGMEVIGEDGENLEDDDDDVKTGSDEEMEEEEGEDGPADSPGTVKEEVKRKEPGDQEKPVKKEKEEEGDHGREEVPEEVSRIKMEDEGPELNREPVETTETPEEEEQQEEEPDLANCITLDELGDDESDDQADGADGADGDKPKGFIEMSRSSEALRALSVLSSKTLDFHGSKLDVQISHKYQRLSEGSAVQSDCESDERTDHGSRSGRREKSSKPRSSEKEEEEEEEEESARRSSERDESKETPEEESVTTNTPQEELTAKTTVADEERPSVCSEKEKEEKKEESARRSSERDESKKTPEEESVTTNTPQEELTAKTTVADEERPSVCSEKEKKEESARRSSERDESKKTPEEESVATNTPQEELTAKRTVADEERPSVCSEKEKEEEMEEEKEASSKPGMGDPETRENPSATDPRGPDAEKRGSADGPTDAAEPEPEQQPGPAGGDVEPDTPTIPVGVEFVKPVVGYFCNLCQLIYSSEDEAKKQHCSSIAHYRKYQEITGKNPWTS